MYFDYAATSIKRSDLIKKLINEIDLFDGNASSTHKLGRQAKMHLDSARKIIAESINAKPKNIIFTSGASESNNTVIKHFSKMNKKIISTKIEHKSILESFKDYEMLELLDVGNNGRVDLSELEKAIDENTALVSIIFVNNETGVIQPIKEIGEFIKKFNEEHDTNIWYHVDAVQALGHLEIDIDEIQCDSLSLSGHKIGGFNGFGVLYTRVRISPLIDGGNQEFGMRSGTSNVLGALSMAESIDMIKSESTKIRELKDYFLENLDIPFEINGDIDFSVNHIVNLYLPFVKSDFLLTYLDMRDIFVSAGSACNAGSLEPSYVIEEMYDKDRAESSVRFSFGFTNTIEEIDELIKVLNELYEKKKN